jgi:hypothetical protein
MAVAATLFLACYQQPELSPQRPLRCTSSQAKGECPKGFACIADRVCAPTSCESNADCPQGLACTSRGCVVPPDGGEGDAAGGLLPGPVDGSALEAGGAEAGFEAAMAPDAPPRSSPDGGQD